MRQPVLIDTNVCIGVINGTISPTTLADFDLHLSVITCAELIALPGLSANEETKIKNFFGQCGILPINLAIALTAGRLCRTHSRKLPDMLIASTAIRLGWPLLTSDKGLRNVRQLQILSP